MNPERYRLFCHQWRRRKKYPFLSDPVCSLIDSGRIPSLRLFCTLHVFFGVKTTGFMRNHAGFCKNRAGFMERRGNPGFLMARIFRPLRLAHSLIPAGFGHGNCTIP